MNSKNPIFRDFLRISVWGEYRKPVWSSDGESRFKYKMRISGVNFCCERFKQAWDAKWAVFGNPDDNGFTEDMNLNVNGIAISYCPFCAAPVNLALKAENPATKDYSL